MPLRVATFNLLHGMSLRDGQVREADLRAAARALDADVVGLQEVDCGQPRSGGVDQTGVVAAELGAGHARFVPALHGTPGSPAGWRAATGGIDAVGGDGSPTYGVGLVSRLPVREWHVRRFPPAPFAIPLLVPGLPRPRLVRVPDEPRVGVLAVLDTPEGPLTVATAHLSFVPGFNARQLRALARWAAGFPGPRLLLGDFNLPGSLPRRITGWTQLARAATYPSYRPRVQFDHVLADGLDAGAVTGVSAPALDVSDHCALAVSLDLR